jgi:hypothetical protein
MLLGLLVNSELNLAKEDEFHQSHRNGAED